MPDARRYYAPLRAICTLLAVLHVTLCALALPSSAATPASTSVADIYAMPAAAHIDVGEVSAQSAVLIDADSGQILYEKNAHTRLPMASTTKIMTALCAVELAELTDVITVSAKAVGVEGSSVYLCEKEQLTLHQLLYALLLSSANDAAVAIAIGVAGSLEAFADYMNKKAAQLGLQDTHFENPHGLDATEHYTTAYDLSLIARAALAHPALRAICATRKTTIPQGEVQNARLLVNHNKLLRSYEGAIGVKTGFTKRSGRCLVSAAERDGLTLIAVTLNAPDDWNDHTRMLDAGFAAYERVTLCADAGFESMVPVTGGKEGYVLVRNAVSLSVTLPRDRAALHCTVELPRFLYATVERGETVGQLVFRCDVNGDGESEILATAPLQTTYAVERRKPRGLLHRILHQLLPNR